MAIKDEIKEQTVKFKDMTLSQKTDYIYTYYKWWIVGILVLLIFVISTTVTVINNSKPVYLDAVFLNSSAELNGQECTLMQEFVKKYNIDTKEYNLSFDYVTYIDNNYANQVSYMGQTKLMSKYAAEEIDIVCGEESILSGPADVGGYYALDEALPEELLDELESKGYEIYYYTEKVYADDAVPDENGDIPYTDGKTYPAGIYIDNCEMLTGDLSTCVYKKGTGDRIVLAIAWNTNNLEHVIEFIRLISSCEAA